MIKKKKPVVDHSKSICVKADRITVVYADSRKRFTYPIDQPDPNREIKLFGKTLHGVKAMDAKQDPLPLAYRQMLDDILYARQHMTSDEINELPLMRQYNIRVLGAKVERVLHNWKKDIVNTKVDSLLLKLFPRSSFVRQFVELGDGDKPEMDVNHINIFDLVNEFQILQYLQERHLFPTINHELSQPQ